MTWPLLYHRTWRRAAVPLGLAVGLALPCVAAPGDGWQVDKALMRIEVEVTQMPAEPRAGVLVTIPDGGILPRPFPVPVVLDGDGKPLKHEMVWFNPNEALGIVFEPPKAGPKVTVYLRGSAGKPPSTPSGLCPSLLLFTRVTPASSLEEALKFGQMGPPDGMMGPTDIIGNRFNPFGIVDDNYVSYYTGWIRQDGKTKKIYFCTISDEGSALFLDGQRIVDWPGIHTREGGKSGEHGAWVDVTEGLHRIEYYHFEKTGEQEAHALWTDKPISKENKPQTIPSGAYIRSGSARVTQIANRDGRPVAAFSCAGESYLWLGEKPTDLYRFQALFTDCNPPDAVYTWTIAGDVIGGVKSFPWLLEGASAWPITLTVSSKQGGTSGGGSAKCTRTLVPRPLPPPASINNAAHRQTYRETLLAMCKTVPTNQSPCASWSPEIWETLYGVVEPYKGGAILLEIFNRGRKDIQRLKAEDRWYLEDLFFEIIRVVDTNSTPKWIDRLEQEDKDLDRKFHWKLARIDFYLYDQFNLVETRKQVNALQTVATDAEQMVLASIRRGDLARAEGNLEDASRNYSAAQDRYQAKLRNTSVLKATAAAGAAPTGMARTKEELKARRSLRQAVSPLVRSGATPLQSWKTFAVHEAAYYATTRDLLHKGFLFEARDVMNDWEMEFPLNKLSGEYSLAEAEYNIAAGRYEHALRVVNIYCKSVQISPTIPEMLAFKLDCLEKLKRAKEAKEVAEDILKRFPNHPDAAKAKRIALFGI